MHEQTSFKSHAEQKTHEGERFRHVVGMVAYYNSRQEYASKDTSDR